MKVELKRMGVLRTGCILAVCYGIGVLIAVPFMAIAVASDSEGEAWGELFGVFFVLLLYPLLGFIGGIIMAAIYNLVVKITGGMQFELDVEPVIPAAGAGPIDPNPYPGSTGV